VHAILVCSVRAVIEVILNVKIKVGKSSQMFNFQTVITLLWIV